MPVILKNQDAIDSWLNDDLSEDSIHKLTQPYESPDLVSMESTGWLLGETLQVELSLLICLCAFFYHQGHAIHIPYICSLA
jgi:hypothetical protein